MSSKFLATFVPSGSVLKVIVGGSSSLNEALLAIDHIAEATSRLDVRNVLVTVQLLESRLTAIEYAQMAWHATKNLQGLRCAILVGPRRRRGMSEVRLLSSNFRVFLDEDRALEWLLSESP
jgi:hypothetical protein